MTPAQDLAFQFRQQSGTFLLDVTFEAPAHGITGIFGPSGCGKTSVLRCIAGLQKASSGFCKIKEEIWQNETHFRQPHQRAIGYVFQDTSLFPHLSVRKNLLYGAPSKGQSAKILIDLDDVVSLLGLASLLDRAPQKLSGGEKQRVAIGRALLSAPKLLLMDEPLSALDRRAKDEILPFLERLHQHLSLPIIYVSHDMSEVERLANHLVLMEHGRVIASESLSSLQTNLSLPLARERDASVMLDAHVEAYDQTYGLACLQVNGGRFLAPATRLEAGSRQRLRIVASDVSLALEEPKPSTILNVLRARITDAVPLGAQHMVVALILGAEGGGAKILARVTRQSWDRLSLREGIIVFAQVKAVSLAPTRATNTQA